MSHDIDFSTGQPAMAYVGETPWHGFGEELPANQSIEEWVRAARLDWEIQMSPVRYLFNDRALLMPDRFVLARSDTGAALSVVSNDYQVVQPKEVLEFYRSLVERRHYTLETAGALDGGRKVWALAKTGLVANVSTNPQDALGAYVLLATSCDKSLATTATFTSIRVVCQNTLNFAIQDVKSQNRRSIKVSHSRKFDASQIHADLGLMEASWDHFIEKLNPMTEIVLTEPQARGFFESVLLSEKELEERKFSNRKNLEVSQLMSFYKQSPGQSLPTAQGTLWGALNAVTYYVDHIRSSSTDRLDSAWFGVGNQLKEKAWNEALVVTSSRQPTQSSTIALEAAALNQMKEKMLSQGGKMPSEMAIHIAAKMLASKAMRAGSKG
jgi:phage/plasmid-like protein (TIGR03299 family)